MFDSAKWRHRLRRHKISLRRFDAGEFYDGLLTNGFTPAQSEILLLRAATVRVHDCSCGASWSWSMAWCGWGEANETYYPKGLPQFPEKIGLQETETTHER